MSIPGNEGAEWGSGFSYMGYMAKVTSLEDTEAQSEPRVSHARACAPD